jgi:hypothetical protein
LAAVLIVAAASRDFWVGRLERLHALPSSGAQNGSATTRQAAHRRTASELFWPDSSPLMLLDLESGNIAVKPTPRMHSCIGTPPVPVQGTLRPAQRNGPGAPGGGGKLRPSWGLFRARIGTIY